MVIGCSFVPATLRAPLDLSTNAITEIDTVRRDFFSRSFEGPGRDLIL
jgi:hypothetical protein